MGFNVVLHRVCFILILFSTAENIYAQNAPAAANANQNNQGKRTSINFEDQLIEGQTQKPDLFYILQQRGGGTRQLIKLRENFLPELRRSSEDVGGVTR